MHTEVSCSQVSSPQPSNNSPYIPLTTQYRTGDMVLQTCNPISQRLSRTALSSRPAELVPESVRVSSYMKCRQQTLYLNLTNGRYPLFFLTTTLASSLAVHTPFTTWHQIFDTLYDRNKDFLSQKTLTNQRLTLNTCANLRWSETQKVESSHFSFKVFLTYYGLVGRQPIKVKKCLATAMDHKLLNRLTPQWYLWNDINIQR